jgi:WD40 repeat protein
MPQFFLQQCGAASDGKLTAVATCNTQAIVAAAREPNVVAFYNDQGEQLGDSVTFTSSVSKLAWQPHGLVLAVGCEDGSLHGVGSCPEARNASARCARMPCRASISVLLAASIRAAGAVVALRLPDLARSEEKCNHKGAVTMLSWSPDGTRLVTGDAVSRDPDAAACRTAQWL